VTTASQTVVVDMESDRASTELAARSLLASNFHFHGRADDFTFQFDEESGVLTVAGTIPSFYLKQLVQSVLRTLTGVSRIDNQVQVASPPLRPRLRGDDAHVGGSTGGPHDDRSNRTS
jgi:hypothetical protein